MEYDVFLLFTQSNNSTIDKNNEKLVFDINNVLKSHGIRTTTWFDEEQQTTTCGPSSDDDIPKTRIDQSRKVILFITKDLIEQINDNSNNNNTIYKRMFEYAYKNMKLMIPIIIEEEMSDKSKWTGVLGNVLGNLLYYDLSPSVVGKMRERIIQMLVEVIREEDAIRGNKTRAQDNTCVSIIYVVHHFLRNEDVIDTLILPFKKQRENIFCSWLNIW
jgi:hypothetical protein